MVGLPEMHNLVIFFLSYFFTEKRLLELDKKYQEKCKIWDQEIRKEYAAKIRKAREEVGMTQEELADALNISRTNVVSLESGNRNITLKTCNQAARAMGKELVITIK